MIVKRFFALLAFLVMMMSLDLASVQAENWGSRPQELGQDSFQPKSVEIPQRDLENIKKFNSSPRKTFEERFREATAPNITPRAAQAFHQQRLLEERQRGFLGYGVAVDYLAGILVTIGVIGGLYFLIRRR